MLIAHRLDRKPICPTCRQPQAEVTKLRRIFTLDFLCDREAKARNKAIPAASTTATAQKESEVEENAYEDMDEEEEEEDELVGRKKEGGGDTHTDADDAVFDSTYAMWSARRDEGIALDNGKRLEARKQGGGRRGPGMHGGRYV